MDKDKAYKIGMKLMMYMDKHNLSYDYYPGCSEPGYDDRPILAANWNGPSSNDYEYKDGKQELTHFGKQKHKLAKIGNYIERHLEPHVGLEWSDEWICCNECNKAVRSSPNSYSWIRSYVWVEDSVICRECYDGCEEEIIDEYTNDYHFGFQNKSLSSEWTERLEKHGFTCWSEKEDYCSSYETGFYPGQNDDPQKVFNAIMEDSRDWDVVFVVLGVGQFDVEWAAYVKKGE